MWELALNYIVLDAETAPYFEGLTFPNYRPLFQSFPVETHFAIGAANDEGEAIALIFGIWSDHPERPNQILSLYVDETYRGQGIATTLLLKVQDATVERNHPYLTGEYGNDLADLRALERVLQKCEFGSSPDDLITVTGPICAAAQLIPTPPTPPASLELVNWAELTQEDIEQILAFAADKEHNGWLNPFINVGLTIHEPTSFVLRYQSKVAGWIQNHEIREGVIRYSRLFVDLEQRGQKFSTHLFYKSLNLHCQLYPDGTSIFAAKSTNTPMLTVINYFSYHPDAQVVRYKTALWAHESVRES